MRKETVNSLMLLGLVNPVLKRTRALCLASAFERVQQETGGPVGRRVRVPSDGHTFSLFTNLHELEAQWMALIYRYRWQIELFFKWLKVYP